MKFKTERDFREMAHPGRLYACYEPRIGFDSEEKVRKAYMAVYRAVPEEVIWHKPGFWLAGPVPEPAGLVAVDEQPNEFGGVDIEVIETTAIEGEQGRLF